MKNQNNQMLLSRLIDSSTYQCVNYYLQQLPEGATLPNSVEEALGDKLVELRNIASQR